MVMVMPIFWLVCGRAVRLVEEDSIDILARQNLFHA
jgi:hypothetical protein